MHTVIARLVLRWVEIVLVAVLVGVLAAAAVQDAYASGAAHANGGQAVLVASYAGVTAARAGG